MMISNQKSTKERVTALEGYICGSDLEIGNSRFGIGLIMLMAGFVGVWSCICLICAIVRSQSLQDIGRGIFTALTGI